jgi:hypothetical protein
MRIEYATRSGSGSQGFHAQKLHKLQEALAHKREHSALQGNSFLHLWVKFDHLDPDQADQNQPHQGFILYLAGTLQLLLILLPQKLFAQRYDLAVVSHNLGEGFLFASKFTASRDPNTGFSTSGFFMNQYSMVAISNFYEIRGFIRRYIKVNQRCQRHRQLKKKNLETGEFLIFC